MERVLISACLIGPKVRYDGHDKAMSHGINRQWQSESAGISVLEHGELALPKAVLAET